MSGERYLDRNVKRENRLQYQSPAEGLSVVPYTADVRRSLYLKYAIDPANRDLGKLPRDIWVEMAAKLDELKGQPIADIGTGSSAYLLQKLLERGHTGPLYGFDTSVENFEVFEEALRMGYPQAEIYLQFGDAQKLPIEKNSLAAATAPFIAYHLPRPGNLFSELHRVIKPGGLAVISGRDTDNTYNLWQIAEMVASEHSARMPSIGSFYSHFPLAQLRQTIDESKGFEFIDYEPQDDVIWIPTTDEGWNDYREAIFSLLPLMRDSYGKHLRKSDVISYLEQNSEFNIRRDIFESLGREYSGNFPDHLIQGFVTARVVK